MRRIVHVKAMSDDWEAFMTEEDARKFVEPFPKHFFVILPIQTISFDEAVEKWDEFIDSLS